MSRPRRALSPETKEALLIAAVKEQRIYHHKAMEQSFRARLKVMPAKQQRLPRIKEGIESLGSLPPNRPPELRYLTKAILDADDREKGILYAVCRYCETHILPHLITKKPMTAGQLMDRVRKARTAQNR
jgi:hypothetical protein